MHILRGYIAIYIPPWGGMLHLLHAKPIYVCAHISLFRACAKLARACAKFCAWTHMKPLHALMSIIGQKNPGQNSKITFFIWMTLTFDLWPWPSNLSEMSSRSIPVLNLVTIHQSVPRESVHALTHKHTDTHTHSVFITSTADAGGKDKNATLTHPV